MQRGDGVGSGGVRLLGSCSWLTGKTALAAATVARSCQRRWAESKGRAIKPDGEGTCGTPRWAERAGTSAERMRTGFREEYLTGWGTLGGEVGNLGLSGEGTGTGKLCQGRRKRMRIQEQGEKGRREQEEVKLKR